MSRSLEPQGWISGRAIQTPITHNCAKNANVIYKADVRSNNLQFPPRDTVVRPFKDQPLIATNWSLEFHMFREFRVSRVFYVVGRGIGF